MPNPNKKVLVELGDGGNVIRIFKNIKQWATSCQYGSATMTKAEAVLRIREQVYERSLKQCERCGKGITWKTMEMNEKRPKGAGGGKSGGEVSLTNCEALCHDCHQGHPDSAHGNRRWHTAKLKGPND